jgi:hypothetical protein
MFVTWLRSKLDRRRSVRRAAAPGRRPLLEALEERTLLDGSPWLGYAHDAQHTALSPVASQSLEVIRWQTPVDLNPQYGNGGDLLIHYGSPLVTPANTVIVPVKTGANGDFELTAFNGFNGAALWTRTTDYVLPPANWTPSYAPTLTPTGRLYFAGAGGTLYAMDAPDAGGTISGPLVFYGLDHYNADRAVYNQGVFINTPLTADAAGNVYFGFEVAGDDTPLHLQGGIARIAPDGSATYVEAHTAADDPDIWNTARNSAPALSNDGSKLYVAVNGTDQHGYLLELDSTTLATVNKVELKDVTHPDYDASVSNDSTASPTVGPDGDVYFGVLENPFGSSKGWLLHFSGDLSESKTPGAFGWDDTVAVVPASMVPSYQGTSTYLLMTKYNNYADLGGDGVNKLAILDPNDTQTDSRTGATVMKEIMTISGVTPDQQFLADHPDAVREWCINTAVVDPATHSVLANSEDGKLYRWDLTSNSFTQVITLTPGVGEAYTPTLIGADGAVYAVNNATLFAVGEQVADAGFERISVANPDPALAFAYNPTGSAWTFQGASGLSANGSLFTAGNPNAPEGSQVAFVQNDGIISQAVALTAGSYSFSFLAAQRGNFSDAPETIQVLLDDVVIGLDTPGDLTYSQYTTATFSVAAGYHTLSLVGFNSLGLGTATAFIDKVQVHPVG